MAPQKQPLTLLKNRAEKTLNSCASSQPLKDSDVSTKHGKITCDVECNPLHGPRAEELIKALEAGEEVQKLNYVDEEIFAADDTVDKVTAVNSLDEEGEYAVTPITQEIIDGRAY